MQTIRSFPIALMAIAILSGCSTTAKNSALSAAHISYNEARNNPKVTNLAADEINIAGESLSKADQALSKGEGDSAVSHLAYIANQQVRIANETAFRKTDELTVANAGATRNQVRLDARTSEVVAAKAETAAAKEEVKVANDTAMQQSEELAAANANAERDQMLITQQEEQLKKLNAIKTTRGLVITLGDVLFSSGKAEIKAGGAKSVAKLADFLTVYPQRKVWIEGYTDSTGSNMVNQALSEDRANAVRSRLIAMGINSERIITRGYGEQFPVANNNTASNRQMNRRVEIILSDNNGDILAR